MVSHIMLFNVREEKLNLYIQDLKNNILKGNKQPTDLTKIEMSHDTHHHPERNSFQATFIWQTVTQMWTSIIISLLRLTDFVLPTNEN